MKKRSSGLLNAEKRLFQRIFTFSVTWIKSREQKMIKMCTFLKPKTGDRRCTGACQWVFLRLISPPVVPVWGVAGRRRRRRRGASSSGSLTLGGPAPRRRVPGPAVLGVRGSPPPGSGGPGPGSGRVQGSSDGGREHRRGQQRAAREAVLWGGAPSSGGRVAETEAEGVSPHTHTPHLQQAGRFWGPCRRVRHLFYLLAGPWGVARPLTGSSSPSSIPSLLQ